MLKTTLSAAASLLLLAPHTAAPYGNTNPPAEFPQMKEGLWSIHMVTTTNPGNRVVDGTSTLCRNHAYDEYAHSLSTRTASCTVIKDGDVAGVWTIESDCKVGASVIHTHSTVKAIDANNVHSETHATYTPPAFGTSETTSTQDQKFVGACPAGVAPGDMTLGNGMVRHLWKH
jgi:hypothetical protein